MFLHLAGANGYIISLIFSSLFLLIKVDYYC